MKKFITKNCFPIPEQKVNLRFTSITRINSSDVFYKEFVTQVST